MIPTLESIIRSDNELIIIQRWGQNDYDVYFSESDCSVRGTLLEVIQEIERFLAATQEPKF